MPAATGILIRTIVATTIRMHFRKVLETRMHTAPAFSMECRQRRLEIAITSAVVISMSRPPSLDLPIRHEVSVRVPASIVTRIQGKTEEESAFFGQSMLFVIDITKRRDVE
jgi:hypothetical protein